MKITMSKYSLREALCNAKKERKKERNEGFKKLFSNNKCLIDILGITKTALQKAGYIFWKKATNTYNS